MSNYENQYIQNEFKTGQNQVSIFVSIQNINKIIDSNYISDFKN